VLAALLLSAPGTAEAGGGRLSPVRDRYEPGEVATLVGYTGGPAAAAVAGEFFYAYLRPVDEDPGAGLDETDLYVGELFIQETAHAGYLAFRVSVTFDVPGDLDPGEYELTYCDDPCTATPVGDLGPSPLSIGVDPGRRIVREWAPDEPEIANLGPDALLVGPGFQTTAAELRTPAPPPAPIPPPLPDPVIELPSPPAPVPAPASEEMDWRVPSALVAASAAATAVVLGRRQRHPSAARRSSGSRPVTPAGDRRTGAAPAGRG